MVHQELQWDDTEEEEEEDDYLLEFPLEELEVKHFVKITCLVLTKLTATSCW